MTDDAVPLTMKDDYSIDDPSKLRILLVEDKKHDTLAALRAFEDAVPACDVTTCVRAEKAIEILEASESSFDVIVSDLSLPGIHGLEFCANLVSERPDQVIVILTGSGSEEMAVRALKAGISDYIIKDPNGYYTKMLPVVIPQVARQGRERAVRRQLAQALRKSEEAFRAIIETSKDWIWATNLDGILTYSNPAIQSILGYTEDEIIGKPYLDFVHTDDKGMMEQRFREPQKLQHGWSNFVIRRLHKNDDYRFLESNAVPILNDAKEFAGFRGVDRDITERKQMEKELKHLASHDPLTGLYNRGELKLRLHDEIQRASRYSNPLSAFLVDADHFKLINDTYGHRTGDSVLKNFAKILELAIRNTDYVARYGGEEFVVILPETPLPKAAELAERLRAQIEESLFLTEEGKELKLTASIGVAAFSEHIQNGQDLLNAADTAMYAAKKAGRNLVKTTDYLVTGISTPQ